MIDRKLGITCTIMELPPRLDEETKKWIFIFNRVMRFHIKMWKI